MKKHIVFIALLTVLSHLAHSQDNQPNIIGLRAGVNIQNITGKEFDGSDTDNDLKVGYNLGITAQFGIATNFYFQTGLLYSTKGASQNTSFAGQSIETKISLGYLELPLHLLYKPMLGSGHLILGFGPYVAYGITGGGKYETSGIISTSGDIDVKYENEVSASDISGDVVIRPFDAGADIFFGYEFSNRLSAQINTQLGLLKINPEYSGVSDDKTSYKNTGFGLSVGYLF